MNASSIINSATTQKIVFFLLFSFAAIESKAQTIELTSPDHNISYSFRRAKDSPVYSVLYKGDALVEDSPLWLNFNEGGKFAKGLSFGARVFRQVNDAHGYSEVTIPIKERDGLKRHVNLIIRAYNDGIAFRYDFAGEQEWSTFTVKNEHAGFNLVKDPMLLTRLNASSTIDTAIDAVTALDQSNTAAVLPAQTLWRFMQINNTVSASLLSEMQTTFNKTK